ncbi:MAG TPA: hypothetical protein VIK27_09805 [Candidatus Aquilonibacter sp.]
MQRSALIAALLLSIAPRPLRANDDLLARMAALNPSVHSYSAVMHAHVTLTSFPFLSANITANYFHKNPDLDKVEVTAGLPAVAKGFSNLYAHLEPPSRWNAVYVVTKKADDGKIATYTLVPRAQGNVTSITATVNDASATIRSMRWEYAAGGWASMDDHYALIQGATLIASQTGEVQEPSYSGDVTTTFSDYRLNPNLPDTLFTQ